MCWTQLIWSPCGAVCCAKKRAGERGIPFCPCWRWEGQSAGKGGLKLVQYNPSLTELVSLYPGLYKLVTKLPGSPKCRQGEAISTHHAGRCPEQSPCPAEGKLSLRFLSAPSTRTSPVATPMLFPHSSQGVLKQIAMCNAFFSFSMHAFSIEEFVDPHQHVISHVAPETLILAWVTGRREDDTTRSVGRNWLGRCICWEKHLQSLAQKLRGWFAAKWGKDRRVNNVKISPTW